ncbi:ankyrin repeat-containing domain protein [Aspergillus californicus]
MSTPASTSKPTDLLVKIPSELVLDIFDLLDKKDLASIALASKTTREYANKIFYRMSLDEVNRVFWWAIRRAVSQTVLNILIANPSMLEENPGLGSEAMYCACKTGNVAHVHVLLERGVSPDPLVLAGHHVLSPLAVAVTYNHAGVVRILTSRGVKLHIPEFVHNFFVLCRGRPDRLGTAQILVQHGFDIDRVDSDGNSFLHHACRMGTSAATTVFNVELLLDLGLDINQQNHHGETPLTWAIKAKFLRVITLLLSRGADLKAGNSPIDAALTIKEDPHETVKYLLDAGAPFTEQSGLELIRRAFVSTRTCSLTHFLDAWKAQFSISNCSDSALLFCAAAATGDIPLLSDMLEGGKVDVNCEVEKRTALVAATETRKIEAVKFLIPRVSNYDTHALNGQTALHIAICGGSEEAIRLLLPYTRSINMADTFTRTPLLDAIEYQPTAIVSLLLDKILLSPSTKGALSAPKDTLSHNNPTLNPSQMLSAALRTAVKLLKLDVVLLLLKHRDLIESERHTSHALHQALDAGNLDIAAALVEWGISAHDQDSRGFTPLMKAIKLGFTELAETLINKGVGLEIRSSEMQGATALTLAVDNNYTDLVTCLIAAGANPNDRIHNHYNESYTPEYRDTLFFYAIKMNYIGIVKTLIPLYDINEPDLIHYDGASALQVAVMKGHVEVIRALLEVENINVGHKDEWGKTALDFARESRFQIPSDVIEKLKEPDAGWLKKLSLLSL